MSLSSAKPISATQIRDQAETIAALLNEYMLEYPNNANLLSFVLTEIFGSLEAFQAEFYNRLSEGQREEFQKLVDRLAEEQRQKKQRFHMLLNVRGFQEIVDNLRHSNVGKAAKADPAASTRPDATPSGGTGTGTGPFRKNRKGI